MFFDEVPPDTSIYMIAGYSLFVLITAIYLVSLFIRTRNLRRDLETLEGLQAEAEAPAPEPARPAARKKAKSGAAKSKKPAQPRKKAPRKR